MNIHELIKKYDNECFATISTDVVLDDLKQLGEHYKPVEVEQFVSDWYEQHKDEFEINLFKAIDKIPMFYQDGDLSKFEEWLIDVQTTPFQTLVSMHLFGYTINKEPKYLVRMVGIGNDDSYLKYNIKSDFWYLGTNETYKNTRVKHTMKELEDNGFKEVFPSPLFEIIEVKE